MINNHMGEIHIKNPFVPEYYLKRWGDSNHQICVYPGIYVGGAE
jgi:hypothetical protein